jgi:transposase InsO family protein
LAFSRASRKVGARSVAWYNSERLHSACGYVPPKEFKESYYAQQGTLVA